MYNTDTNWESIAILWNEISEALNAETHPQVIELVLCQIFLNMEQKLCSDTSKGWQLFMVKLLFIVYVQLFSLFMTPIVQ